MQSKAANPDKYMRELPPDRVEAMTRLRDTILKNLPKGFEETMQYGMLSYVVPHSLYPAGYHCTPTDALPFMSLASQKNNISFYHMGMYMMPDLLTWFQAEYPKQSKGKLDMGKSCVRFKKMDDIPYKLIGELVKKVKVKDWIAVYESNLKR
ncbi:MAG: DUF1801 domain-containing protein [Chitinophagaceae bacterium]|nr:DUF1801 domain-containing protein [Chitinophagaceae bacterium]